MKKLVFVLIIFININVLASGGTLKQNSIIECNGIYYGNHGNPLHWHKAKKVNDKWVSDGNEVEIPFCYIKPVNVFEEVKFSKCVDGDTAKLIINREEKTVRFLAINTPEVGGGEKEEEPFGKEASNYTCNRLSKAKKIILEYDSNSDKEDKYGRVLAFIYVDDDLLEFELIKNGLARVAYIYGDYNHVDELYELENIAKEEKIGIWSEANPDIADNNEDISLRDILLAIFKIIYQFIIKLFA